MIASKVLIVDDMEVNITILDKIIQGLGYETDTAQDGKSALKLAAKTQYHCILLDILMPGLSGFDVIKKLKRMPGYADVPVIFITGEEGPESIAKGFELGAVDYVTKPFHALEIRARVRSHIKLFLTIQSLAHAQAETLQQIHHAQNSLQIKPEDNPEAEFSVYYQALHAAGGDIYEILNLGEETYGYFVGDFSGHNISTSFLTSSVKALLRQNCRSLYTPVESMRLVNSVLCQLMPSGLYLTAVYIVVNRKKQVYSIVSMGHPPIIFVPGTNEPVHKIGMRGDVLGVFEEALFKERIYKILPGDRLVLYTDGLIEGEHVWANNVPDLVAMAAECRHDEREEFITHLREKTATLRENSDDDILLMAIDIPGDANGIARAMDNSVLQLNFPSSRRLISGVVEEALDYLENEQKIDMGDERYGVQLILHEALTNAVVHGNHEQIFTSVSVEVYCDKDGELTVTVTDEGIGFDWEKVVARPVDWHEGASGRGIFLFKKYGYGIVYNEKGTSLTLTKKLI